MVTKPLEYLDPRIVRIVDRNGPFEHSGAETGNVWADKLGEQCEHFALVVVAAGLGLGVDHLVVDGDVEHAGAAGDHGELIDDVLVVGEEIRCCAHGVA